MRMAPGSEGVGVVGAGKTPPAAGLVKMSLTDSRGIFELDLARQGSCPVWWCRRTGARGA